MMYKPGVHLPVDDIQVGRQLLRLEMSKKLRQILFQENLICLEVCLHLFRQQAVVVNIYYVPQVTRS